MLEASLADADTSYSGISQASVAFVILIMACILYQNVSRTVTLLDLPRSISKPSEGLQPISSVAPSQSFPSNEPKGSKREEVLSSIPQDEQRYHAQLAQLITSAIQEVHQEMGERKWCLDRTAPCLRGRRSDTNEEQRPQYDGLASSLKRYQRCGTNEWHRPEELQDNALASSLQKHKPSGTTEGNQRRRQHDIAKGLLAPPLVLSTVANHYDSVAALQDTIVFNSSASVVRMHISERSFSIPSHCAFLLSSIQQGLHVFETSAKASGSLPDAIYPGPFNLILLDPPWPNRSVRNAKVYNTYERQLELHPFYETLPIIGRHLSAAGVVAVWITNKRAIRRSVLRSLREMGLDLYEEWIWLKITSNGEPVAALNGLWRKPYEILLLFCRQVAVHGGQTDLPDYPAVKQRVLIAVPDIHSRKPGLRELLKAFMPENYRALEIFARNLTTGWWSWGDEVLKFNEDCAA
jgi:N6-adenosine-specific RNA methylase IME4